MSEFYPIIFGLIFVGILGGAAILFLRVFNPPWWRYRWVKLAIVLAIVMGAISIICWAMGIAYGISMLLAFGATSTALTIILLIALILSLPVSGVVHGVGWLIRKLYKIKNIDSVSNFDPQRRLFLKTAAAAIPSVTILAGAGGFVESFTSTTIPKIAMTYNKLSPSLIGLRILQISDCHLGFYFYLSNLEQLLADADKEHPDLILVTGDLADDLTVLPDALRMIAQIKTKYGIFSSLGNHEYYRGIAEVLRIYRAGPIPLLINEGISLKVGNANLYLGGADDPRFLRRDATEFFESTVAKAMANRPADSFSILMSHRPDAFDFASESGVDLTLSGHTHGGQIGFAGRSVFEPVLPYKYLWGKYLHHGGGQLYTTCGVGHWFPFRLGCRSEAPLIILDSGLIK